MKINETSLTNIEIAYEHKCKYNEQLHNFQTRLNSIKVEAIEVTGVNVSTDFTT